VYTGIAGSHIRSTNSRGMVKIKEKEVSQADIDRVLETASSISLPGDQQILHILEQEFCIDVRTASRSRGYERYAAGCRGAYRHGAVAAVQNIMKCIHRCGLEVNELICSRWHPARRVGR